MRILPSWKLVINGLFCLLALFSVAWAETGIKSSHAVEIDPAKPFPSIMFSDILKSMSDQVMWEKGQLRFFERVRMTFLPEFTDPQHIAAYNSTTGAHLVSQMKNEAGELLQTVFWEARKDKFPYWTASATGLSDPPTFPAGKYSISWLIDGVEFWSLPFSIDKKSAANAYDTAATYLQGPWNDWAYIYIPNGNVDQTPTFNFFLRDVNASPGNWTRTDVEVEILRDGVTIAQQGMVGDTVLDAKPWWIAHELSLRSPENGSYFQARNILQTGNYSIKLRINGDLYATYLYEAKDGQIPFMGQQDRESADPKTYLEGATDRFYLARQE